jgi:hypothetical protein
MDADHSLAPRRAQVHSAVKREWNDLLERRGEARMELFDDLEVSYNQERRNPTVGRFSPVAFERRAQTTRVARYVSSRDLVRPIIDWRA